MICQYASQCQLLGLSRSKVYYQAAEPSEEQRRQEELLMGRMDYWHTTMPYIRSRKLVKKWKEEEHPVGRTLVRRLMAEMGICAVYPKANLLKRKFKEVIVPYLLRNKTVFLSNQVWSIDIISIKITHGHLYLTAIIDWHSRMITGWNLSDTLDSCYIIHAVKDAVSRYGTPAILNSDQGSPFTSAEYKQLLKTLHITKSIDGQSRWADDIMIEPWFRSLKAEEIDINEYDSP